MDTPQQSGNLISRQYAQFKWFEFRFSGKVTRQEYLEEAALYGFLQLIVYIATLVISIPTMGIGAFLGLPVLLLLMIHVVGLSVRRLRDTGKSGAYIFMAFIPLAGLAIVFYQMMEESVPETAGAVTLPPTPNTMGQPQQPLPFEAAPAPAPAPAPVPAPAHTICSLCNGSGVNAAGHTCPMCSGKGVAN